MAKIEKRVIGVDLGGTNIKFGIVDQSGTLLKKISKPTHAEKGPGAVIAQITKGVKELLKTEERIKGIGIGAPGVVRSKKGTVENPPNFPGWEIVHLGKELEKELEYDVSVENDANAAAIGEMIFGAGKEHESFLMITLGTGVGGGIILKRKIYRGEIGAAGEIGHVSIDYNGPPCNCGSFGCIEAYLGNKYLVSRISAELGKHPTSKIFECIGYDFANLSPKTVSIAALDGDQFAQDIITEAGMKLGVAIASLCNLLDIGTIIIGGGVAGFGAALFASAQKTIEARVLTPLRGRIRLYPAQLQNEAGIIGAASLALYKG